MLSLFNSMFLKKYNIIIILTLIISSFGIFQIAVAQPNNASKTFEDTKTGINFQYPTNWQIASKEYMNSLFRNTSSRTVPIVILFPESLNGVSFSIISEILPFPMPSDKYMKLTKQNSFSDPFNQLNNITSTHIGNLNGFKYSASFNNGSYKQTQIVFTKGSTGFVIAYNIGFINQLENINDINSMINSFSVK